MLLLSFFQSALVAYNAPPFFSWQELCACVHPDYQPCRSCLLEKFTAPVNSLYSILFPSTFALVHLRSLPWSPSSLPLPPRTLHFFFLWRNIPWYQLPQNFSTSCFCNSGASLSLLFAPPAYIRFKLHLQSDQSFPRSIFFHFNGGSYFSCFILISFISFCAVAIFLCICPRHFVGYHTIYLSSPFLKCEKLYARHACALDPLGIQKIPSWSLITPFFIPGHVSG